MKDSGIKIREIRQIHRGQYLSYYEIDYINLDGKIKTYEMVSKNHNLTKETIGKTTQAIVLFVFNEDGSKILIPKEFRMGVNQYVYGNIAGLIDCGETPMEAATRELFEETGLELTDVIECEFPAFAAAPVTDDLSMTIICKARGDIRKSDSPDEEIHAQWYTKDEVKELLHNPDVRFAARVQAFCLMWVSAKENI